MREVLTRGRIWALMGVMVIAVVAISAWLVTPLLRAQPGSAVDYRQKLVELVENAQPKGSNAWEDYLRALELHNRLQLEIRQEAPELEKLVHPEYWTIYQGPDAAVAATGDAQVDAMNAEDAARQAADHAVAREWAIKALERFPTAGIDDALDVLVKSTRVVRPKGEGVLIIEVQEDLGASRGLTRALRSRAWLAADRGDEALVIADVERMLALARATGFQGSLIGRLVGISITAATTGVVRERTMIRAFSEQTSLKLMELLDTRTVLPLMSVAIEAERLRVLDYMQAIHTDDGNGDGIRLVTRAKEIADEANGEAPRRYSRLQNLGGLTLPSKKEMVKKVNETYDGVTKAADTPRAGRAAVFDIDGYEAAQGEKYKLVTMVVPSLGKSINASDQVRMEVGGTRLMLGIAVYRSRHGKPPAKLEDLVPGVMASLPPDPYAPDAKFRYVVLDGRDEEGREYLLYSVGADGADDQGTAARSRFEALREGAGKGTDFVINAND